MTPLAMVFKFGSVLFVGVAVLVGGWAALVNDTSPVWKYWHRYCTSLEKKLRLLHNFTPGRNIAIGQLVAILAIVTYHLAFGFEIWWLFAFIAAFVPQRYIERLKQKRVAQIEDQLDGFLTTLANALKATPSVGNSFISIQLLLPQPFRQEVELAVKEMRVGSTLDQALLNLGGRVGSRQLDSALCAILIGRQLGGDLPKILETTANTLREMVRLEGVVKSKTAEGRAQIWVLGVFPFAFAVIMNWMQPGFYDPLKEPVMGWALAGFAGITWLASLLMARKILSVDV
ncbi:MAG TPA: type II secretion system F family protein [Polyangiaceae bacterium]|nr:type II secretion system F family protein [Polyangiaceae bacterium]HMR76329.1 type II secretion system F family protein [Polyangiaceae bacterium]